MGDVVTGLAGSAEAPVTGSGARYSGLIPAAWTIAL
jgi:hypothetical protein